MSDKDTPSSTTPDGAESELSAGLGAWLPIETAPTGKRILVCVPIAKHRLVIAFKNDFGLLLDEQMQPMPYPPFWWMPLPPAPND